MKVVLDTVLREINEKTTENDQYPVLTSSKAGIFLQSDYFNKQVASKDNTGYKAIRRGQFTYRAMSDTGEFFPNMLECTDIGIVSPAYPVFEIVKPDVIIPEFLKYFFKSNVFQYSIASFAQGSTRTSIKFGKLKTVSINLPGIERQAQIVRILNRASKIIQDRTLEIQKLDDLIKARFVELFEDDLKKTGLTIRDIAEEATVGIANSATHAYSETGIAMLRNQNIRANYLDDEDLIFITSEFAKKYEGKALKKNDILITRTGANVGMACLVPSKYEGCQTFTTLILRVKENIGMTPMFVCYYINSPLGKRFIDENKVGGAQPNFGVKQLITMPIVIPQKEKQIEFEKVVKQVDKSKAIVQIALSETQLLFDSLMQKYFG